jgi:hypothetical protein
MAIDPRAARPESGLADPPPTAMMEPQGQKVKSEGLGPKSLAARRVLVDDGLEPGIHLLGGLHLADRQPLRLTVGQPGAARVPRLGRDHGPVLVAQFRPQRAIRVKSPHDAVELVVGVWRLDSARELAARSRIPKCDGPRLGIVVVGNHRAACATGGPENEGPGLPALRKRAGDAQATVRHAQFIGAVR